jgi:arginyl-tRNA synthetase
MLYGVGRIYTWYLIYILFIMLRSIQTLRMRPPVALRVHRTALSRMMSAQADKPDFRNEFDSKYFDFQRAEANIYKWWEHSGYFKPKINDNARKFVMSMPPPNVTGYLHMGHAIFIALQDIMARFHRMKGVETLWLPGT